MLLAVRRGFTLIALALAFGACFVPSAGAESLYRGRGAGIRVELRVKHGEVSFARVRTVLRCIRDGRRQRRPFGKALGTSRLRDGRFRISFETEEPGYSEEFLLVGGVHPGEITGRFWYQREYDGRSVCQTRHYQSLGIRHLGRDSLRFWAARRPIHSPVRR
jgi:hypothetical protein